LNSEKGYGTLKYIVHEV